MMDPSLQQAQLYHDLSGLQAYRNAAKKNEQEALPGVAKQFESIFIQMVMDSMRKANEALGKGIFDSNEMGMYQDMFDKQLSVTLAEAGGVGLSDLIVKQMQQTKENLSDNRNFSGMTAQLSGQPSTAVINGPIFKEKKEFIKAMLPDAEYAGGLLGVDPRLLLAQTALETGWGQAIPQNKSGENSHNVFSIKADSKWNGDVVVKDTLDYMNGIANRVKEKFRSYASYSDSFSDFVEFVKSNERFQAGLNSAGRPDQFIEALTGGGFANDPNYAKKVMKIYHSDFMKDLLGSIK